MKHKYIYKPWGYEIWFEVNDDYVVKELFMKEGHSCSLQYHDYKHESFYLMSGILKLTVGDSVDQLTDIILKPGDFYVLPPKKIHRAEGITDAIYIECSTNHLDDVIRIEDKYGRV